MREAGQAGEGDPGPALHGWGRAPKVWGLPGAHLAHTRHKRCSPSAGGLGADSCLVGRKPKQADSWRVGGSEDGRNHTAPRGG